jgi:hypothetical protein
LTGCGTIFGGKTMASALVLRLVEIIHANGTTNPAQISSSAACVPSHDFPSRRAIACDHFP